MKKTLLLTVGFAALSTAPAFAADLASRNYTKAPAYVAPLPSWAGFYLGVNGGGAWSHNCWDVNFGDGAPISPARAEGCSNASGGVVGGQLGYRWQASNWVFGLEAQGDWASLKGSNASLAAFVPLNNQTKTDAFGLFTGQIGYAWTNVLGYVKGGAAVTHSKYDGTIVGLGPFDTAKETRWGGTVGAGVEYGFAPNWSVAVEYDHLFMGKNNVTLSSPLNVRTDAIKQDIDMATARVNYRFGAPLVARY